MVCKEHFRSKDEAIFCRIPNPNVNSGFDAAYEPNNFQGCQLYLFEALPGEAEGQVCKAAENCLANAFGRIN